MNLKDKIYNSIIGICQESKNPDALANKVAIQVTEALLPRQQRLIYDSLESSAKTSREIGQELGLPSKLISAQLKQMSVNTSLISQTNNGRIIVWNRKY